MERTGALCSRSIIFSHTLVFPDAVPPATPMIKGREGGPECLHCSPKYFAYIVSPRADDRQLSRTICSAQARNDSKWYFARTLARRCPVSVANAMLLLLLQRTCNLTSSTRWLCLTFFMKAVPALCASTRGWNMDGKQDLQLMLQILHGNSRIKRYHERNQEQSLELVTT